MAHLLQSGPTRFWHSRLCLSETVRGRSPERGGARAARWPSCHTWRRWTHSGPLYRLRHTTSTWSDEMEKFKRRHHLNLRCRYWAFKKHFITSAHPNLWLLMPRVWWHVSVAYKVAQQPISFLSQSGVLTQTAWWRRCSCSLPRRAWSPHRISNGIPQKPGGSHL